MNKPNTTAWLFAGVLLAALRGPTAAADTYTVNNTSGSGLGSLSAAVAQANGNPGNDTINFSVADTTIIPDATLEIKDTAGVLTIDGTGQNITISGGGTQRVFYVDSGAELQLEGLTVANGLADGDGGGLYNQGTVIINNSTFSGNSAESLGGGLYNNSTVTVTNSTFSGNISIYGGGLLADGGTVTVTNSTFSGNRASDGGGLANLTSIVTVTNSTFSGNIPSDGVGFYNLYGTSTIANSILANNGEDCHNEYGTINQSGVNLIETQYNCGTAAITDDPMLDALADNGGPTQTMALQAGSPAIDSADDTICADPDTVNSRDQRGITRPQGDHCDIGAYEFVPEVEMISIATIIDFYNSSIDDGSISGAGPGNSAPHREKTILNQLLAAGSFIDSGDIESACMQLSDTLKRIDTDGVLGADEFVTGDSAGELATQIGQLQEQLSCSVD